MNRDDLYRAGFKLDGRGGVIRLSPGQWYAKYFPTMSTDPNIQIQPITLRDHFAAAALIGIMAGRDHQYPPQEAERIAEKAFQLAGAMLAARGARVEPK